MSFLLDTDHLSLLQKPSAIEYPRVAARVAANAAAGVAACVVSVQEQTGGANAKVNAARGPTDILRGYQLLLELLDFYRGLTVLPFDGVAQAEFDRQRAAKVRVGTMDLRIACIALCRNLTVVTRNTSDFARVPGLRTEDWSR